MKKEMYRIVKATHQAAWHMRRNDGLTDEEFAIQLFWENLDTEDVSKLYDTIDEARAYAKARGWDSKPRTIENSYNGQTIIDVEAYLIEEAEYEEEAGEFEFIQGSDYDNI